MNEDNEKQLRKEIKKLRLMIQAQEREMTMRGLGLSPRPIRGVLVKVGGKFHME